MSTDERRNDLRKAIEAYTAEGPNDGPNDGPEEKALLELLDAIQAFDTIIDPDVKEWRRIVAAVPPFLTASADQVRDLRVAWEAFDAAEKAPPPEPRKPVAGWEVGHLRGWSAMRRAPILRAGPLAARADKAGAWWLIDDGNEEDVSVTLDLGDEGTLEAAQFAAEDAMFAIADAINTLRGGR